MDVIDPRDLDVVCTPQITAPTEQQYSALQQAFTHFNRVLFAGRLSSPLIVLQRQRNVMGHYCAGRFVSMSDDKTRVDELALNPAFFRSRGPRDVCSTLVHEQCHAFVRHFGRPTRAGYHDRQWAELMKRIGLQPSHTGAPGGRETGYKMSDYVIEGGPFAVAFDALMRSTNGITWGDATTIAWGDALPQEDVTPPKPKRIKVICPRCGFSTPLVPSAVGRIGCIPCGGGSVALVPA